MTYKEFKALLEQTEKQIKTPKPLPKFVLMTSEKEKETILRVLGGEPPYYWEDV